ncbi:cation:proton antiporter [Burkholderia oklahomensis]|uniref:cation:proton antiporter n=2 Tax=Burkholderia oklahomensis TaxID=342113 RepID=UPI0005D9264B|nr:cation:proton antiporter [Burkholderia oklahomensis]AJX31681.1 sodium/hydrogen exchanger family protein [Burkholderia oklahomensis C6786]AOI45234.1 potassium transporter [Burkholderia oklahomensis C6786]KUY59537.1 potassium transporter [Burkholderia oklahomensis C6786]MBI0358703.1 cation:proton antiporter [Burkholderia oklahomensis]MDN7672260.1 cation:proton antiporter [Burkholderia oklahomensis]
MWLLQLAIVITVCHACGHLAERIGQARVIGEIAAGILLGPTIFGAFAPDVHRALFPAATQSGIALLCEVGLVLLMFEVGLHLRIPNTFSWADVRLPGLVALLGLALPFALGVGVALGSKDALAAGYAPVPYALFCGVALGVSAVPVMARIVADLGLSAHPSATTALASAMLTDVAGWLLLALVASVAQPGHGDGFTLLLSMVSIALYAVACVASLRYVVGPLLQRASARGNVRIVAVVVTGCVLASAWGTHALGFHGAFGALLAGLALRDAPAVADQWRRTFSGFVHVVLTPVFFAYAGLHTSISALDDVGAWTWFGAFFIAGFAGKFGGAYAAARWCARTPHDAMLIGALMNARGLMELIVLSIGLQLGVLPQKVYTILVAFALLTTAMTTPFVRYATRPGAAPLADPQT